MNNEILDAPLSEQETLLQHKLSSWSRLKSMFLDHFLMCMLIVPPLILINWALDNILKDSVFINDSHLIGFAVLTPLYFMKDIINGRSLAKRITGQIIIDSKTKLPTNEIKCILRNITIPFSFIEVLVVLLFNPSKRIGDLIAGTEVVKTDSVPFSETKKEFKAYSKSKFLGYWLITFLGFIAIYVFIKTVFS